MRIGLGREAGPRKLAVAALGAVAALVVVVAPASARAADLIQPHAVEPHHVEVHAAPPAAAASQHAAPPDAPEDLPGSQVPPDENELPYPDDLPSPFGGCGADVGCLQIWHDWYFRRVSLLRGVDDEAANLLRDELNAIDDQIRENGSVPGQWVTEGSPDGLGDPIVDEGQPSSGGMDPPSSAGPVVSAIDVVVDAISGAGPVVPQNGEVDLGTVDLSGWGTFFDMLSGGSLGLLLGPSLSPKSSTTACDKKTVDGKVPYCPS